ncbi:MAG: hypothetical protein ACI9R3_005103 [Verrucomicrobiales bacterium]|jgi:hypothetical protein
MIRTNQFLLLGLTFAGLNSWQLAQGGLVAHWPLNEGSGDVFNDIAGGFDGFLPIAEFDEQAEIEWSEEGPPHQENAVEFLGANSFIATNFPGIGGSNPRTVALWVRTEDTDAYFLAWGSNEPTRKWHIRTQPGASGGMRTEFANGQNFADSSVIDGEWHHVASVFPNGASEGEEILHYVDGVLDEQTGGTSQPIDTSIVTDEEVDWTDADSLEPYPVHFGGALAHGFGRMLEGSMADVRIYDEGLSEEEIRAIFDGDGVGAPSSAFEITEIVYDESVPSIDITFTSRPGRTYAIETTTSLEAEGPGSWVELDDGVNSEGDETTYTDTVDAMGDFVFYRVTEI